MLADKHNMSENNTNSEHGAPRGPSHIVMQRVIAVIALGITFIVLGSVFVPQDTTAGPSDNGQHNGRADGHTNNHADDAAHPNTLPDANTDTDGPPTEAWGDVTLTQDTSDPHAGLPLLGSLEGPCYRTLIYGTDVGPRFTVIPIGEQDPVAVLLDSRTLTKYFPDVPQPTVASNGELQVMYVDPAGDLPY